MVKTNKVQAEQEIRYLACDWCGREIVGIIPDEYPKETDYVWISGPDTEGKRYDFCAEHFEEVKRYLEHE